MMMAVFRGHLRGRLGDPMAQEATAIKTGQMTPNANGTYRTAIRGWKLRKLGVCVALSLYAIHAVGSMNARMAAITSDSHKTYPVILGRAGDDINVQLTIDHQCIQNR